MPQYYYWSHRRCAIRFCIILSIFIISIFLTVLWILHIAVPSNDVNTIIKNYDNQQEYKQPRIFCFALTLNARQTLSSRALVYSWGKRCDRFYFVTRLQNTSIDLMMLEQFENTSDITPKNIVRETLNVLTYIEKNIALSSYQWFLRASDETFVIVPNLRRLVAELHSKGQTRPLAYAGDVERMYQKYDIVSTGSALLLNRPALIRLVSARSTDFELGMEEEHQKCPDKMIYDYEMVRCLKKADVQTNLINDDLILSQNLSMYRMDQRLKGICCSPKTVAFRATNETDLYKFEFFYHRLKAYA